MLGGAADREKRAGGRRGRMRTWCTMQAGIERRRGGSIKGMPAGAASPKGPRRRA